MTCVRQKNALQKGVAAPVWDFVSKAGCTQKNNNCHQLPPSQIFPRRNNKNEAFFFLPRNSSLTVGVLGARELFLKLML